MYSKYCVLLSGKILHLYIYKYLDSRSCAVEQPKVSQAPACLRPDFFQGDSRPILAFSCSHLCFYYVNLLGNYNYSTVTFVVCSTKTVISVMCARPPLAGTNISNISAKNGGPKGLRWPLNWADTYKTRVTLAVVNDQNNWRINARNGMRCSSDMFVGRTTSYIGQTPQQHFKYTPPSQHAQTAPSVLRTEFHENLF